MNIAFAFNKHVNKLICYNYLNLLFYKIFLNIIFILLAIFKCFLCYHNILLVHKVLFHYITSSLFLLRSHL